jgi:hypothetical protein
VVEPVALAAAVATRISPLGTGDAHGLVVL